MPEARGGGRVAWPPLLAPLRRRELRLVAGAGFALGLADWLAGAALVGWAYTQAGTLGASAVLLVRIAAPALGTPLALAAADRARTRALVAAESAYACGLALTALAAWAGSVPAALAGFALANLFESTSYATRGALVPALCEDDELPRANALVSGATALATALGAVAGGVGLAVAGPVPAVAAAALAAATGAAAYGRLPTLPTPERTRSSARLVDALRRRGCAVPVLALGAVVLATGIVNATLPRLLGGELGLGEAGYGVGFAALTAGFALGNLAVAALRRTPSLGAALLALAVTLAALSAAAAAPVALALLVAAGIASAAGDVVFVTLLQRETDDAVRGRVLAAAGSALQLATVAALAAAPLVNAVAGPRQAVLAAALWCALAGVVVRGGGAAPPLTSVS